MGSPSFSSALVPANHAATGGKVFMVGVPTSALAFGFSNDPVGTHGSRTMMLAELRQLLANCPSSASQEDYRSAIIGENVLLKKTLSTRRESFRRLRELYALTNEIVLFRALRDMWEADPDAQPLLALLCATARDPILRGTACLVLSTPHGEPVTPQMIAKATDECFPHRYNATTLANIGRHAASTWRQSGHLAGRLNKVRSKVESRPTAAAYALFLGYLCGEGGDGLLDTVWTRLLESPAYILREKAFAASQKGWLEYRHAGNVTDIGFRYLLREKDRDYML
ncbi:MAG: hypothetical protein HYX94_06530 [Chloroflexi bacterium]|nr:hypothetical protein [Chloroflexota bacterium]